MGQDRPINALLPGFAQVHVFNSTRIKPFIPVYMPIAMYLGVFAQNTPRSRVSACFHLPSTASTALHVLSKCQTRVKRSACSARIRSPQKASQVLPLTAPRSRPPTAGPRDRGPVCYSNSHTAINVRPDPVTSAFSRGSPRLETRCCCHTDLGPVVGGLRSCSGFFIRAH